MELDWRTTFFSVHESCNALGDCAWGLATNSFNSLTWIQMKVGFKILFDKELVSFLPSLQTFFKDFMMLSQLLLFRANWNQGTKNWPVLMIIFKKAKLLATKNKAVSMDDTWVIKDVAGPQKLSLDWRRNSDSTGRVGEMGRAGRLTRFYRKSSPPCPWPDKGWMIQDILKPFNIFIWPWHQMSISKFTNYNLILAIMTNMWKSLPIPSSA